MECGLSFVAKHCGRIHIATKNKATMTLKFYALSFPSTLTSELDLHLTVLASCLTALPSGFFEHSSSHSMWFCRATRMSPDPGKVPNQVGQPQHALLLAQANPICFCHPSSLVLLQSWAHPLPHPLSTVSASREAQPSSSSASCSSSLTLSFLRVKT